MSLVPAVISSAVVFAALATAADSAGNKLPPGTWTPVDCSVFQVAAPHGSAVRCGYVSAPLHHADPNGAAIQLATVVLPGPPSGKRPDPLFLAQGGPGGSTIDAYAGYLIANPKARPANDRDLVMWDQRGTPHSKPALTCPEVAQAELAAAQAGEKDADETAAYEACGRRLAAEAGDLSGFNSAENAHDIDTVRQALGYDAINFYGFSYGAELGQFLMREHPEHLRSAVLDGAAPLSNNPFTEPAFVKQRFTEKYLAACAADAHCNARFPNLAARWLALTDRLDADPETVSVAPPYGGGQRYQAPLTGQLLERAVYDALHTDPRNLIPLLVDSADRGDYSYVASMLLPATFLGTATSAGVRETMACADHGDTNPDAVDFHGVPAGLADQTKADAKRELEVCRQWRIDLLPRAMLEPVQSPVPTLLLSGGADAITPPSYSASLLPSLPYGRQVVFPRGSHGQEMRSVCANSITQHFLDNPKGKLDVSCANNTAPRFATERDIITLPRMKRMLDAGGAGGVVSSALRMAPSFIGVLFLLSALLVYPVGWVTKKLLGWDSEDPRPTATRLAPWLAVISAVVLAVFFLGMVISIGSTLATNQNLVAMGALPGRWRWLFTLPMIGVSVAIAMVITAIVLWASHQRSVAGRVYFTLLTAAAVAGVANMFKLGVVGLWHA